MQCDAITCLITTCFNHSLYFYSVEYFSSPTTPTKSIITAPLVKKLSTSLTSSTTSQNPPQQQQQQQQQSSSSAATATIAVSSAPVKRKLDTGNQTPIKRGRKEKDKTKEKSRNDAFIVVR